MKKYKCIGILSFALVATISGCTLEAAKEVGDTCKDTAYVWFGGTNQIFEKGTDSEYEIYLNAGVCPIQAPHCMKMLAYDDYDADGRLTAYPEVHYCSDRRGDCPKDSHPHEGNCERDFADQCGSHDTNCVDPKKGIASGACIDGARGKECRTDTCLNETVQLEDGSTEVFNLFVWLDGECRTGDQCCGPFCKNCSLATPKPQVCYSDEDLSTDCGDGCPNPDMIVCNGVCVNPKTSMVYCGSETNRDGSCDIHYCKANPGWLNGSCIDGICQVSSCLPKYHLKTDGKGLNYCEPDSPTACGAAATNCTSIPHSDAVDCEVGTCVVKHCENGYAPYDGECIPFSGESCGPVTNICGINQHCDTQKEECSCNTDYTDCDGICYDLRSSVNHCGGCAIKCTGDAHGTAKCENSRCVIECDTEEYTYNTSTGHCEPLAVKVCSAGEWDCNDDGLLCCGCKGACDDTACDNSVCEPLVSCYENVDCKTNCCKDHVCVAAGQCGTPIECGEGSHIYENDCEPDDEENCGSHGHACAVFNADNACVNGECTFSCHHGYVETSDGLGCETSVCTNGDTSCYNDNDTGYIKSCENNSWGNPNPCESNTSCKDDTSCGDCINNKKQCVEQSGYQVCVLGQWGETISCAAPTNGSATCTDGDCGKSCNNAEYPNLCTDRCVNTSKDPNNCGSCDKKCTTADVSNASAVGCSESKCVATGCVNGFDLSNGTCAKHVCNTNEHKCESNRFYTCSDNDWGAGTYCSDGCTSSGCNNHVCEAGEHKCESSRLYTCSNNDWGAGEMCEAPTNGTAICIGSDECGYTCKNGFCDTGSACVNKQTDMNNCGSCGTICNTTKVSHSTAVKCENGTCKATACAGGYDLSNGKCSSHICSTGDTKCEDDIFYTCSGNDWDEGIECSAPTHGSPICDDDDGCIGYECDYGYCDTGSECADKQTDMNNCGGCGNICNTSTVSHSTAVKCESGSCKATACASPYTLSSGACMCQSGTCDTGSECVSKQTDMNNCGSCGNVCNTTKVSHSTAVTCEDGDCVAMACASPYFVDEGDCIKCNTGYERCGSVCVATQTDMSNCGGCGIVCNTSKVTHSSAVTCEDGDCIATACASPYTLNSGACACPTNYPTQCNNSCVNTNNDSNHCGGCNIVCNTSTVPHSSAVRCEDGDCIATACASPYVVNSDGECVCGPNYHVYNNSCEADSPEHCGAHGARCSSPSSHGSATCNNGSCGISCDSGYCPTDSDCVSKQTDTNNCGSCGNVCIKPVIGDAACVNGNCIASCPSNYTNFSNQCYENFYRCDGALSNEIVCSSPNIRCEEYDYYDCTYISTFSNHCGETSIYCGEAGSDLCSDLSSEYGVGSCVFIAN